jgi:hypothetical protein
MGTSLTWLVARRESSFEDVMNRRGGRAASLQGAWMVFEFPLRPLKDDARLVEDASAATGEPSLGIRVQDGDFAIVMLGVPGSEVSYVVLQPELAAEDEEGVWALARAPHGAGWNERAQAALLGWAEAAGLMASPKALSEVLASRSVDVVVDAEELLVALGLPRLPHESPVYQGALTVQDHGKAVLSNGRLVDMAKVPYVWGHTADGFSIWPRSGGAPVAPVARFRKGEGDAYHKTQAAWEELLIHPQEPMKRRLRRRRWLQG